MTTLLNSDSPLRGRGLSNAVDAASLARHRWYFVKEAFSPSLVQHAIDATQLKHGDTVIDPFAGSGTVPLVAALAGMSVNSYEVNPFLAFLTSAKLRNNSGRGLEKAARTVLRATGRPVRSRLEAFSTFSKGNPWDRWLFPTSVLRAFEAGKTHLQNVDPKYRSHLKLALISGAMDCCNATRDGKCLRFRPGWKERESDADDFRERFGVRLNHVVEDVQAVQVPYTANRIRRGDARRLVTESAPFDLCVTSPPYLNSFDYSDIYRPELFLGDFVHSAEGLRALRSRTLRSHVQSKWPAPTNADFGTLYREVIAHVLEQTDSLWNTRLASMIQAYFEDMELVLRSLKRRAGVRASVWLVVSTSAYGGIEIPVDLILAEMAQRCGWLLREVGVLRYLRSSSQHAKRVEDVSRKSVPLRESVVILDATDS